MFPVSGKERRAKELEARGICSGKAHWRRYVLIQQGLSKFTSRVPSSFCIMRRNLTGSQAARPRIRGSVPAKCNKYSSFPEHPDGFLVLCSGYLGLFPQG